MHHFKILLNIIFFVVCLQNKSVALNVTNCGITKNCIFFPPGCSPTSLSCQIFSYIYVLSEDRFIMEIFGKAETGNIYAAAAFSFNLLMDNADLYYCTGVELKSGVIDQRWQRPITQPSLPSGVVLLDARMDEGIVECRFYRPGTLTKTIGSNPTMFDLTDGDFHLLQASGSLSLGDISQHTRSGRNASGPYRFIAEPFRMTVAETTTATTIPTTVRSAMTTSAVTGCGMSIGCFRDPPDCMPSSSGCRFLSWLYDPMSESFDLEFIGGAAGGYVAIAFGTEPAMENADLYYCTQTQFFSGAIQTESRPFASEVRGTNSDELENISVGSENGVLRCSFTRPASVIKDALNGPTDFDLDTTKYYLLFASGNTLGNGLLRYHNSARTRTKTTIDFRVLASIEVSGENGSGIFRVHAFLLAFSVTSAIICF